jgi:hypothetical protein
VEADPPAVDGLGGEADAADRDRVPDRVDAAVSGASTTSVRPLSPPSAETTPADLAHDPREHERGYRGRRGTA